ncbi:MAG: general secretion pathway protein GspK, partial [Hydrogenophaga sp.]|nr:general secretion pathway protein GspK [Hydrogenophaga sp.]
MKSHRGFISRQRGAALLLAMLVVTLVATLASAAVWQQWRSAEVEAAERQRVQASWILTGALDWARLILREDARGNRNSGHADHLGEPWA